MSGSELVQVVNEDERRRQEAIPSRQASAPMAGRPLDDPLTMSLIATSRVYDGVDWSAVIEEGPLAVPDNFHHVLPGLYRSSFPRQEHFEYLGRLGLKSVLTLTQEELPSDNLDFLRRNGIQHFQVGMPGNKEPFVNIPDHQLYDALKIVLDSQKHPLLVHCNRGKHRTGCVIGCVRKIQRWSYASIFDEYRRFAYPKARALDQQLIELYDITDIMADEVMLAFSPKWSR